MSAYALPLRGIRVANFGVGGVAPWASSLLAQLGATVVKIEAPNEFIMYTLPPWRGLTTTYAALNANVHSVKLNLKDDCDRKLAWTLAETADVMVENFRSGAIDRMGFGFDTVAAAQSGHHFLLVERLRPQRPDGGAAVHRSPHAGVLRFCRAQR